MAFRFASVSFLLAATLSASRDVQIHVVNRCTEPIWLGSWNLPLETPLLKPKDEMTIQHRIDGPQKSSLWARTDCSDEKVFMDCWKDLAEDVPCWNGTYFYCQDNVYNNPYQCRGHEQGPFPPESCTEQCVITSAYQSGFLASLKPKDTPADMLHVKKFGCITGNCAKKASLGESLEVCSDNSALTTPATVAEFSFGDEDRYHISLVDGFNLNLTVQGANCDMTSCKMNPWSQCQSELMDLDVRTSRSFCWSYKSALPSAAEGSWPSWMDEEANLKLQKACPEAVTDPKSAQDKMKDKICAGEVGDYKVTFC